MDAGQVMAQGAALVVTVASWEGWKLLRAFLRDRRPTVRHTPPSLPVNGFSRDDHASLAVITEKLERMDVTLGRLDNDLGRLVIVLELERSRPPR